MQSVSGSGARDKGQQLLPETGGHVKIYRKE
jgi:hypothetical protein